MTLSSEFLTQLHTATQVPAKLRKQWIKWKENEKKTAAEKKAKKKRTAEQEVSGVQHSTHPSPFLFIRKLPPPELANSSHSSRPRHCARVTSQAEQQQAKRKKSASQANKKSATGAKNATDGEPL